MFAKFFALLLLPLLAATAQQAPSNSQHVVRASGEASVSGKPDQLRIAVGVTTQAATADEAAAQDAAKMDKVIATLKPIVGSNGEIKTSNFAVAPQYKYVQGQSPTITGYQANHTLEVVLTDISAAGKLIDAATKQLKELHLKVVYPEKYPPVVSADAKSARAGDNIPAPAVREISVW